MKIIIIVGQQINRSFKLPSYEYQQKSNHNDIQQESPLKDQLNKPNFRIGQNKKLKQVSITQPVQQDVQDENIMRFSFNGEFKNKINNNYKQDSKENNDIYINEFDPQIMSQTPKQISSFQILSPNPQSQIQYKMNISKKQELERIQEKDDEKFNQSQQQSLSKKLKNENQLQLNSNKTLKEFDVQLKEVLNTCRFKDLQNLLEESKNQLKNDVQEIINGLESDQQLIQNKIDNLQDEYNSMKIKKSQNIEVDETRFIQIEKNLQKQINYLQSLRNGLQQSQNHMCKPFQRQDDIQSNNEQNNIQANTMIKSSKFEEIKSHNQLNLDEYQIHKTENSKNPHTQQIKSQNKQTDIKALQNTDNIQLLDESFIFDQKQKNITQVKQNVRGKIVSALPKLEKNRYQIHQQFQQEKITQKEQNDNRKQEQRKNLDLQEKKLNYLNVSHTDIHRRSDSRNRQHDLKQLKSESSTVNTRSKKCMSAMNQNDPRLSHEIQDKDTLNKLQENKKPFTSTNRGIFHSVSKIRMLSNSPENKFNSIKNNSQLVTEKDKSRLQVNKTDQNIKEIKITPKNIVRKRMNNYSVIESRNRGLNKTPETYKNEQNKSKILDRSLNQLTPHKEILSEYKIKINKDNQSNGQNTMQEIRLLSGQNTENSMSSNNKYNSQSQNTRFNQSKDNMNISQVLSKVSQSTNRQKRSYFNNVNTDPFEETQNSYLHTDQSLLKSKVDYMDQVKQKYQLKSSPENWKLIANDEYIENDVKIEKLKQFSQMLSVKAKRKIQLSRVKQKNSRNQQYLNEDLLEADELIINSIKAKLAIIETVNKEYEEQISEYGESLEQ